MDEIEMGLKIKGPIPMFWKLRLSTNLGERQGLVNKYPFSILPEQLDNL